MRFAAISDVHGNLLALESVLTDIADCGVTMIVNLGDLVSGPLLPAETADCLMRLNVPTICGNHERQLLETSLEKMGPSDRYAATQLQPRHWEWLRTYPLSFTFDGVRLCHGTPASDLEYFVETVTPQGARQATNDEVQKRAGTAPESLIICGHTHVPRVVRISDQRTVLNPGSVGLQAFSDDSPFPHQLETGSPDARYAIVEKTSDGWDIDIRCVEYDWEAAARLADERDRPDWGIALRTGKIPG